MPDNKDELLKQQNEEIQKLKKELKAATKPSSMLSVLKSTVRRNVHDFFIREDKIKSVQEENKKLKKELEETKEERDKTSAQLFAAINLGSDNQEQTSFEEGGTPGDTCDAPVFPQTAEEAVREYFGPVDLAALARQVYPGQSMQHQNPEPESAAPPKIKDTPIIQEQPDSSVKNEKKPDDNIVCEPGPSDSTLHTGSNPRSKSSNEGIKPALSKEKSIKQDLSDNPPSELEDGPMQEDINEAPFEDDLPDLTELPEDLPDISGGSVWDMEEQPTEPQAEPEAIQVEHTEEPADESLKKSLKEFPKEPPKKTQKKPAKAFSATHKSRREIKTSAKNSREKNRKIRQRAENNRKTRCCRTAKPA